MIIEYESKYDENIKDLLVELQEYIVSIDREGYNIITPEYREKYFLETMDDINKNQGKILLAIDNNRVIGLIIGLIIEGYSNYEFKAPRRGQISELIISSTCRAKGTGGALLKAMEAHLNSVGCENILIGVFGYNQLAINFYRKHGYHTRMLDMTKMLKENNNYICKIASIEEINKKWDYEINNHPGDNSWVVWKKKFINSVKKGKRICYYGIINGQIISEATAVIDKNDIQNSEGLIDDHTAYLNAFRTIPLYQHQGYFSKLYKFMEIDLKNKGYTKLTLGVEPSEVKNIQIYFNWGYTNFIKTDYEKYPKENDHSKAERIMVNYYSKNI